MQTADFDFELPLELIAQAPAPKRDQSRLLVLDRDSGRIEHRGFRDLLEYLRPGDVLVLNNSRVIPARLRGANIKTGGRFEVLLLEEHGANDWWVMLRPGKRARVGTRIVFGDPQGHPSQIQATVVEQNEEGHRRLCFSGTPNILEALEVLGEVPLPPYISRADTGQMDQDRQRYQTVFAQPAGSVAAPTAGLHFTATLLDQIRSRGVQVCFLTLHVGLGTFAPVKSESLAAHIMHEERYHLSEETARTINEAKCAGRRVFAVGTTTVRVLESVAALASQTSRASDSEALPPRYGGGRRQEPDALSRRPEIQSSPAPAAAERAPAPLRAGAGRTRIFIYPPYPFKIVDALLTNFHLPRSTLLMLVSAFAAPNEMRGRQAILSAYAEAVRQRYRFFSYGDAMLVL
jgi:S-adenosylmethionine:tRNA ribosyltransferase-isomerase